MVCYDEAHLSIQYFLNWFPVASYDEMLFGALCCFQFISVISHKSQLHVLSNQN